MSQPANAPTPFVPFEPLPASTSPAGASGFKLKVVPAAEPGTPPISSRFHAHALSGTNARGSPTVTLQRDGDKITGIRIECICGQVIELACVY